MAGDAAAPPQLVLCSVVCQLVAFNARATGSMLHRRSALCHSGHCGFRLVPSRALRVCGLCRPLSCAVHAGSCWLVLLCNATLLNVAIKSLKQNSSICAAACRLCKYDRGICAPMLHCTACPMRFQSHPFHHMCHEFSEGQQ